MALTSSSIKSVHCGTNDKLAAPAPLLERKNCPETGRLKQGGFTHLPLHDRIAGTRIHTHKARIPRPSSQFGNSRVSPGDPGFRRGLQGRGRGRGAPGLPTAAVQIENTTGAIKQISSRSYLV